MRRTRSARRPALSCVRTFCGVAVAFAGSELQLGTKAPATTTPPAKPTLAERLAACTYNTPAARASDHHLIEGGRQAANVATTVNLGAQERVARRVALAQQEIESGGGVYDVEVYAPQRAAGVAQPRVAGLDSLIDG
jgi:hypothetical protein